jgi:tetratricopeptide (TPR) repeat protein
MFQKKIVVLMLLLFVAVFLSSCSESINFQKVSNKISISYEELEVYYLERGSKLSEPIAREDKPIYNQFRAVLGHTDTEKIREVLVVIEKDLETPASPDYKNKVSLYLLLGQFYEDLLADNEKALSVYKKIWTEYKTISLLHPYFDSKKKVFTNEWYLMVSDAEAILRAGHIYNKLGEKQLALACYQRVLRYYTNEARGSYTYDFPDKYGRIVIPYILKLKAYKLPKLERVRSFGGDRRVEFSKLAQKFPDDLVSEDLGKWMSFIPEGGISVGYDIAEEKWTSAEVVVYQLQNRIGPQYDMLLGWLRGANAETAALQVKIERVGSQFVANISYPKVGKKLHLNFETFHSFWYLTGIYLY